MKKILFAIALMPLLFVACSSDDDNKDEPGQDFDYNIELLFGEWRATHIEGKRAFDLTDPLNELYAAPTYLKFNKDGSLEGEGLFGDGTGRYSANKKSIHTSIGNTRKSLEVHSLEANTAKVKLNAKDLNTSLITDDEGIVTITFSKNYSRTPNFTYNINDLYGKWRATTIEGVDDKPIDLTNPIIENFIEPTYVTFEEKGIYSTEGFLGKGKGRYSTKEKTIYTLIKDKKLERNIKLQVSSLNKETARVVISLDELNLGLDDLKDVDKVTVILIKQKDN